VKTTSEGDKENTMFRTNLALKEQSDAAVIAAFQAGDRDAFRYLVDRYKERVRNVVYSIFNDKTLVDDLAQEVFIRVYKALPTFRSESAFYTWVYRIAVNRCRDEIRSRKLRKIFSLHSLTENPDETMPHEFAEAPEDNSARELVALGLQAIPEKFRLPIVLKDIEGLSYDEIAGVLDCEVGTVKSRLSRGRALLRKKLEPIWKAE
jgi:RNA polymerase sigma-70 factor, ECF subfamily